jgi:CheY-like chemotaxis protein
MDEATEARLSCSTPLRQERRRRFDSPPSTASRGSTGLCRGREERHGTAFTIYLPAGGEADSSSLDALSERPRGPEGTETVLLVEEDEGVRLLLRDILELHGYRVIEAGDPEEALSLAERRAEPIHLVITDVSMTAMSGLALVDRVAASRPGVKVLYMSGYTADGLLSSSRAFLEKPFTMAGLLGMVREVLDG